MESSKIIDFVKSQEIGNKIHSLECLFTIVCESNDNELCLSNVSLIMKTLNRKSLRPHGMKITFEENTTVTEFLG